MVIVAHVVLENSSLFPGSTVQCSLELLNTSTSSIQTLGAYDSNLLSLFTNYKGTTEISMHNNGDVGSNNESSNKQADEEEEDYFGKSKGKVLYYTKSSPVAPAKPAPQAEQSTLNAVSDKLDQEWNIDLVYAQICGVCSGDSAWLHPIVDESQLLKTKEGEVIPQTKMYNDAYMYLDKQPLELSHLKSLITAKKNQQVIFVSHPKTFPQYHKKSLSLREKKVMEFSMQLPPADATPPSFKGRVVRYSYFVSVYFQISSKTEGVIKKTVTLPFTVHNPLASVSSVYSRFHKSFNFRWEFQKEFVSKIHQRLITGEEYSNNSSASSSLSSSPSVSTLSAHFENKANINEDKQHADHLIKRMVALQQQQTQKKGSSFFFVFETIERILASNAATKHFNITHGSNLVCKFSIRSTAFQIGDTVLGIFDFSKTEVTCFKVFCDLIFEETIVGWLVKTNNSTGKYSASNPNHSKHVKLDPKIGQTSVAYFVEHTLNTITTNFQMMIPPHAPAQFQTDLVHVKWFLKFSFFIQSKTASTGSSKPSFETLEWILPIQVFVPSDLRPLHTKSIAKELCFLFTKESPQ